MERFKDNFSKQSDFYQRYRPTYPDVLFEFLAGLTREHTLAWDCGTGNGQAATALAKHYTTVYATDPSAKQITNAQQHPRVVYKMERAENSGLDNSSADLVTVAQALHWFDFDGFYAEVKRVLKPDGIIAVWAYGLPNITEAVDKVIKYFHHEVLGEYWQYENRQIDKEYLAIPFPFQQLETPLFKIHKTLELDDVLGLLNSWSAVQHYITKNDHNPIDDIKEELSAAWGEDAKEVTWRLILKVGKCDLK